MKIKSSVVGWLALGLLCVACGKKESVHSVSEKTAGDRKLHWLTDFGAAKAEARTQKKTLLVNFTGSDWCPPCMAMEKTVFSQPEFVAYASKNLVLMEVDFPRRKKQAPELAAANQKLASEYGVDGFPTIGILDPDGKPLGALGYRPDITVESFIAEIEKLRSAAGKVGS